MDYFKKNEIVSNDLSLYHQGCRDCKELNIMLCNETKSFVLDKDLKTDYKSKGFLYWNVSNINESLLKTLDDDNRRYELLRELGISFSNIIDFGCGNGGFLRLVKHHNKNNICVGVDLNEEVIDHLNNHENGVYACNDINYIPKSCPNTFDVITLFHVLEHLSDPITILKKLKTKMNKDSTLIIEVPSATDILLTKYDCKPFKEFTFWSEHLILYTHESLNRLLEKCQFKHIQIINEQRYNLLNHIQWLSKGLPGGHNCESTKINLILNEYNQHLKENNLTDTLIALCKI